MHRTTVPALLLLTLALSYLTGCTASSRFSCDSPRTDRPSCSECPVGCSDDDLRAACAIFSSSVLYAEPCRPGDATCTLRSRDGRVNVWHFYDPYPRDEARELCFSVTGASVVFEER